MKRLNREGNKKENQQLTWMSNKINKSQKNKLNQKE